MIDTIKSKRVAPLILLCTLLSFTNPYFAQHPEPIRIFASDPELIEQYIDPLNFEIPVEIVDEHANADLLLTSKYNFATGEDFLLVLVQNTHFRLPLSPVLQTIDYTPAGPFTSQTSGDEVSNYIEAALHYIVGDCDTMQRIFEQMNSEDESVIEHRAIYQGVCALLDEDFDSATTYFSQLQDTTLFAVSPAIVNLAWMSLKNDDVERAFALLNVHVDAMANAQTSIAFPASGARATRAQFHALNFDYDSALADMNAAIDLLPVDEPEEHALLIAEQLTLRGRLTLLIYEWDDVLSDYNRAIEIAPDYAPAYYWRGLLFYTQGPREQALEDFQQYLTLAPDGEFADDAQKYADEIQLELDALND